MKNRQHFPQIRPSRSEIGKIPSALIRNIQNPIRVGYKFVQYLKDHPDSTYDDLAGISGVSKDRVCQMVALYNRLPSRITDYLMNADEPEVLKYFTERRFRPLTLLASDDDKIIKFMEMKEAFVIGNTS